MCLSETKLELLFTGWGNSLVIDYFKGIPSHLVESLLK